MVTMSSFGKPAFSWMCTRSTHPLPSCAWTDSPPVAVLREIPMILRLVLAVAADVVDVCSDGADAAGADAVGDLQGG
jgi:hypothetical protein